MYTEKAVLCPDGRKRTFYRYGEYNNNGFVRIGVSNVTGTLCQQYLDGPYWFDPDPYGTNYKLLSADVANTHRIAVLEAVIEQARIDGIDCTRSVAELAKWLGYSVDDSTDSERT